MEKVKTHYVASHGAIIKVKELKHKEPSTEPNVYVAKYANELVIISRLEFLDMENDFLIMYE